MRIYSSFIAFFIYGIFAAQKVWSFNDCLEYAKENNLQVTASRLNVKVQEENYKISKKEKLPDVIGSVSNAITYAPKTKYSPVFGVKRKDNYTGVYSNELSLSSTILLYNYGKLRKNEEKNEILLQQNKYITERIQKDISLQLVGNYLTVLLNKELSGVEKNYLQNNQEQFDRSQKLFQAGSIPRSSLYEAKANLANAKQKYETSVIEIDRSLMTLAMLLQKDYEDFEIEGVAMPDEITLPLMDIYGIVEYAYSNQPDIKSSELGIEAAKKDIELAKTALYPSITGGYRLGTAYTDLFEIKDKTLNKQWYDNHDHIFTIGLNIPIFNKGINKLKIEQSKIQQEIKENDLDQQKLALKQSIQTSYFDVTSSYQIFLSAKESTESTKVSFDAAQLSFSAGKINVYDLNIASNNYYNALSQMIQAKYSYVFRTKILDYYAGKPLEISGNTTTTVSPILNLEQPVEKEVKDSDTIEISDVTQNKDEEGVVAPQEDSYNEYKDENEEALVKEATNKQTEQEEKKVNNQEVRKERKEMKKEKEAVETTLSEEEKHPVEPDKSIEKEVESKVKPVLEKAEKIEVNEGAHGSDLFKEDLSEEEKQRRQAIYELRKKRKEKELKMGQEVLHLFER